MSTAPNTLVFVYGKNPRIGSEEADAGHDELVIATRHAAEEIRAARNCRTWGEYADLCGRTWQDFLEDHGGEVEDLTGREEPGRDAPFDFTEIHGLYYVGDLLPEARTDAYETLVKLPKTVREDARLRDLLEWSGGSPAGHVASVTARSEEAIRLFERIIHEAGYRGYRFERDDALVRLVVGY